MALAAIALGPIAPAWGLPHLTLTVFGDVPAFEYVPRPLPAKDLLNRANAEGSPRTPGHDTSRGVPSSRPTQAPVAVGTVIPGVMEGRAVPAESMPLATVSATQSLDDSRFTDLADEQFAVAQGETKAVQPAEQTVDESEIAEAVRQAAEEARAKRVDTSMRDEVAAELDKDLELIKFGEVEIGKLTELVEESGSALGLVSVTELIDSDEALFDEEGHVIVKSADEEDDLVQWQIDAFGNVPALAAAGATPDNVLSGQGLGTNRALVQRMANFSDGGATAAQTVTS
ncbi:MAG: hypothetical protein FJX59_07080 [Alphaproteobacteria bacterium]|nr:hypothetical protein [Alphaproteobacteria bacterium]